MLRAAITLALLSAGCTAPATATQPLIPILLSGQSNAVAQAGHLALGSYVVVARGSTSIRAWDWDARDGDLGRQLLDALTGHRFSVFVWWQGETDGFEGMTAEDYAKRFARIRQRVALPTILIEMIDHPSRIHLKRFQAELAASDPLVALVATSDLPMGDAAHDAPEAVRPIITDRVLRCMTASCWAQPAAFR